MSGARERILARIAAGLPAERESSAETVRRRLADHSPRLVPAFARDCDDLAALFVKKSVAAQSTVDVLARVEDLPAAVCRYLVTRGLPLHLVIAGTGLGCDPDWLAAGLESESRPGRSGDSACLVRAYAGVAETGTVVMLSSNSQGSASLYLPDSQLVLLHETDLLAHGEALWQRLRDDGADWPRSINWVTGPSRSADIGMTFAIGAHGPKRVHILLVRS